MSLEDEFNRATEKLKPKSTLEWCDRCDVWHGYNEYPDGTIEVSCSCLHEKISAKMMGIDVEHPPSPNRPWRVLTEDEADEQGNAEEKSKEEKRAGGASQVPDTLPAVIGRKRPRHRKS